MTPIRFIILIMRFMRICMFVVLMINILAFDTCQIHVEQKSFVLSKLKNCLMLAVPSQTCRISLNCKKHVDVLSLLCIGESFSDLHLSMWMHQMCHKFHWMKSWLRYQWFHHKVCSLRIGYGHQCCWIDNWLLWHESESKKWVWQLCHFEPVLILWTSKFESLNFWSLEHD